MKNYYYQGADESVNGPITAEELLTMFQRGEISTETLICEEGSEDWMRFVDCDLNIRPSHESVKEELPKPAVFSPTADKEETPTSQAIPTTQSNVAQANSYPTTKMQANLIIGLLGVIAVFLGIQTFTASTLTSEDINALISEGVKNMTSALNEKPMETVLVDDRTNEEVEYEYEWMEFSRDSYRFESSAGKEINLYGWEYVGPLCNNGINAQYVLFRRKKSKY